MDNQTAASHADRFGIVPQMLLCSFLWAGAFLLLKLAGTSLSPFALTAVRGLMGAALLAAWIGFHGHRILPRGGEWRDWTVLGVLQGIVPNTLTAFALTQISAGLTSMIQATTPSSSPFSRRRCSPTSG